MKTHLGIYTQWSLDFMVRVFGSFNADEAFKKYYSWDKIKSGWMNKQNLCSLSLDELRFGLYADIDNELMIDHHEGNEDEIKQTLVFWLKTTKGWKSVNGMKLTAAVKKLIDTLILAIEKGGDAVPDSPLKEQVVGHPLDQMQITAIELLNKAKADTIDNHNKRLIELDVEYRERRKAFNNECESELKRLQEEIEKVGKITLAWQ